jgi:uncharacterized protein (TIGR02145 family)
VALNINERNYINNLTKEECLKTRVARGTGVLAMAALLLLNGCGTETMKDNDGNIYKTEKIGKQVWMAENLRTTTFNDGTPIPRITENSEWGDLETPGYCYYENSKDAEYQKKWGALYNWYAVQSGGLAPKGWRVPTDDDWKLLQNHLVANGYNYDGSKEENKIAKSLAAKTDWKISTDAGAPGNNLEGNNRTGFSALPGGFRSFGGSFGAIGDYGYWWSATEYDAYRAYYRYLSHGYEDLGRGSSGKSCGNSLRLVRDLD